MICRRCGHHNPEGANFCSSCGAELEATPEETTLALAAIEERLEVEDELSEVLDELPEGMGMLLVSRGPNAGSKYLLDRETTVAGRHPDSDIFLDDVTVSRRHAQIVREGDDYVVRDVGSLNGTYLNRERVEEATLRHSDDLQIGRYRLLFFQGGRQLP